MISVSVFPNTLFPLLLYLVVFPVFSLELLLPVDYVPPPSLPLRRDRKARGVWSGRNAFSLTENKLTEFFSPEYVLVMDKVLGVSQLALISFFQSNEGVFLGFLSWEPVRFPKVKLTEIWGPLKRFLFFNPNTDSSNSSNLPHSNISTNLSLHWLLLQVWLSACACFSWFGGGVSLKPWFFNGY